MVDACRIAIVDKYPIFRIGVVQAIARTKNAIVVAQGATADDAKHIARTKKPHVLLLEAAVPDSLDAARTILQSHQNVKVVILASAEDLEYATQVIQNGAHGYIVKGITGPELTKAIAAVHRGERYVTPDLAWRLVAMPSASASQAETADWRHFSIREQQVLDCASKGLSNQEIACMLGLGLSTIKYYKTIAFRKMGVRNRVEAILAVTKMVKQS